MDHIRLRLKERVYNLEDVAKMRLWAAQPRMAPRQAWFKDFGTFYLTGHWGNVRTVLDKEMAPWGVQIAALGKFRFKSSLLQRKSPTQE